jgi:hypothetical protein
MYTYMHDIITSHSELYHVVAHRFTWKGAVIRVDSNS